jgi:repressor LexA
MSEECSYHASFWQEAAMMMVRKSKGITDKHIRVLEFVNDYQLRNGRPPSIREIGEKVKISSTSVVNYYLLQLEKMGYLERDNRVSRGMRLTGKVNQVVQAGNTLNVPILGPIAAGIPLPELQPGVSYSTESEADAVAIARSLLPSKEKGDNLYALQVQGDSMIDAMINDGDIVVMKPANEARNGEMVAVWLPNNNEATLKYFFKEKDRYRLQPANPTMKPIFIKKTEPLEIKGKVVMVIRKLEKPLAA